MVIRIECREVNGWPIMIANPPQHQAGDRLRIMNFALDRYKDLKLFCDKQRELTKLAKEGKAIRSPSTFRDLLIEALLGESLGSYVDKEVRRRVEAGELCDTSTVTVGKTV